MNEMIAPPKFGLGARALRVEDAALVTGHGRYTGDVQPEGVLEGFVVRSPMGHAKIDFGDVSDAKAVEGVHLIWTPADVADKGQLPCTALIRQTDGSKPEVPPFPLLTGDVVRHVGDAVAFIVADSLEAARNAAELLEIDYDPLPAVVDTDRALDEDAPVIWPQFGTNLAFETEMGEREKTDEAFEKAAKVASLKLVNNRLVCNYLEGRAILAEHDAASDSYTLTIGTQGVHGIRDTLAKKVMNVDPDTMRVLTPDVGGGFGTKAFVYREYPLVAYAAKALGRPVRWVSDRTEHFMSCAQGRDNVADASFALDADGKILAMRLDLVANMGAYLSQQAPFIPFLGLTMTTGLYDVTAMHARLRGVYTNTLPTDAYRGAGRPEAAYIVERLADEAARVAGLTPEEFRRRNFIQPDQFPYKTQAGRTYDSGEFDGHMTKALELADRDTFEDRVAQSAREGKLRGLGFATYIEACAFAGSEPARVELGEDGTVTLYIGTQSTGQGHQTAYAQFVGGHLGVDYDRIRVVQGDTATQETGGGTGGSRSIPLGAPSVDRASKTLASQVKELASEALEASPGDIELVEGTARIVGTDRSITLADVAKGFDKEKLTAKDEYKTDEATYPNGTHVCELEIDPSTGTTEILRYTIVDDFGVVVNPLLLRGQVHGGVVQGIGQALLEHTVYDEDGQLVTASFMDYAMPRADDLPSFRFETRNVPSKHNEMGIKGAGEAGSIGACPAVMNAVVDALHRACGIRHIDMPATPLAVWRAIEEAKASSSRAA